MTMRRYGWKTAAFFPPAVFFIDAQKMKTFEANNFDFEYVKYEYLDANQRVEQIDDFFAKRIHAGSSSGCTCSSRMSPMRRTRAMTLAAATLIAMTVRSRIATPWWAG